MKTYSFNQNLKTENLNLRDMRERFVKEALHRSNGNKTLASNMLGISRKTIDQYIKYK